MDRRKFLSTLIGGVAAAAAVRTFPFRVFSFPKEVVPFPDFRRIDQIIIENWWKIQPFGFATAAEWTVYDLPYDLKRMP